MRTETIRIEWGTLIPALHDMHPTHLSTVDASGCLRVSRGRILRKQLYRQDVKQGGGWVTETPFGELQTNHWETRLKNQIYGLHLTVSDTPEMKFQLTFLWGRMAFTLDQLRQRRLLEWPFGPKYRFLSVRAFVDGTDSMEIGFTNDPFPEACPQKPLLTLDPRAFQGARCFFRYFQREPAWIEQMKEISADFCLSKPSRLYLALYLMLGPPYARPDVQQGRANRTMRSEVLVNGHSLGMRDRWFSCFREDQKVEEITLEVLPGWLKKGANRLTIRNHDHCFHLLLVKAELHERPLTDTPFGATPSKVVLPRGYYTGFDTNMVAPENPEEFKQLLADIRDRQQCNFVLIRPEGSWIHTTDMDEWIRLFKRKGIYFSYLFDETSYTQRLQKQGGSLFLGHFFHEISMAHNYASLQIRNEKHPTMQTAHENYLRYAGWLIRYVKQASPRTKVIFGEPGLLSSLNYLAGVDRVLPQTHWGVHNGILLAEARGANRTIRKGWFGVHFAAGCINYPPLLDTERLYQVSLYTCYLHGVKQLYDEESALAMIHGAKPYSFHSRFCRGRRTLLARYNRFLSENGNPGTPEVPLALMSGRFEYPFPTGFPKLLGNKVWPRFGGVDKVWAPADPEAGWTLMKIFMPGACMPDFPLEGKDLRIWHSGTPFGQFDVISSESPASSWQQYQSIIFPGWNSMDAALYRKLEAFVRGGGRLLMTAPQLSTRVDREYLHDLGHPEFIHAGDVQKLFGIQLLNRRSSAVEVHWEGGSDWLGPARRFRLGAKIKNVGVKIGAARVLARNQHGQPVLVENHLGKGIARLLTLQAFPGAVGLKTLMTVLWQALAVEVRGRVWVKDISTEVAWYRFRKNGQRRLWLLNTDWTTAENVKEARVHADGRTWPVLVPQGEPICVQVEVEARRNDGRHRRSLSKNDEK